MLHELTMLHFQDLRRSLYGSGNYRHVTGFKKYSVKREYWQTFDEDKSQVFSDFLKNKNIRYSNKSQLRKPI